MVNEIKEIADQLAKGQLVAPVTVRSLLSWFGAQRRGNWIVESIKHDLKEVGIITYPDFESAWIDTPINFIKENSFDQSKDADSPEIESSEPIPVTPSGTVSWTGKEATYRVSKLQAANQRVVSVNPDSSLAEVITLLMSNGFSQIPVMVGERTVKGMVSWQSIGTSLALGRKGEFARDFMIEHNEIRSDTSIFAAIPVIAAYDYVLIRGEKGEVSGIVTSSDLNLQFRQLSEPFLLLSEVENLIRNMIGNRFNLADLEDALDPIAAHRDLKSVADLTFGEYIRILQKPERWTQLEIKIDRSTFCKSLDQIREIRNDVMHFDPDGVTQADLEKLRDFANFLRKLEQLHSPR